MIGLLLLLALSDALVGQAQGGLTFTCDDGCQISSQFLNDSHCDCATCEDESPWWDCFLCACPKACGRYETCSFGSPGYGGPGYGGPGYGGPGANCDDGCSLLSIEVNDGVCNCANCEDEESWSCNTCKEGCPATSCDFSAATFCAYFEGDLFTCQNGCTIDAEKINNGFCDCGDCEDEDHWTCAECGCPTAACEPGRACPVKFACADGCLVPNSTLNDNRCDCSQCEDEDRWNSTTCASPGSAACGIGNGCGLLSTQTFFHCERCSIPMEQRNDGHCNCEECEDEDDWTCDSCGGCPWHCGNGTGTECTSTTTTASVTTTITSTATTSTSTDSTTTDSTTTDSTTTDSTTTDSTTTDSITTETTVTSTTISATSVTSVTSSVTETLPPTTSMSTITATTATTVTATTISSTISSTATEIPEIADADVLITELSDPNNMYFVRYVELYSFGGMDLTGLRLVRWMNGNAAYTRSATFNLDGIVLPPGGFLIVCNDKTTFDSLYSPAICDQQAGSGSVADSDGGDTIGIVDAGDNIIDIFGVPGEIMLSQYVFRDGRAERKQGVTSPSDAWIEEDWTVQTAVNAPEGFDPHTWVGTQQTTLTALAEFVADEMSPFVSLALDAARTDLSKTEVTMVRNDAPAGVVLGFTLLTNPFTADLPPGLLQVTTAGPGDAGAPFIAFPDGYLGEPYPALLVASSDYRAPLTSWLPATVAYRPVGGENISLGAIQGTLGDHFLYADLATAESESFLEVVGSQDQHGLLEAYVRLTRNTSYPAAASCLRLGPGDLWTQESLSRPTHSELQAAGVTAPADLNGFWCAARYGFGLFGILVPPASDSTTATTTPTSASGSAALNMQNKVLSLVGGLIQQSLEAMQDPYTAAIVPLQNRPVGTSVALVSLPLYDPFTASDFMVLTAPGNSTIPIAIPSRLRNSITAPYAAVSVAAVQLGVADVTELDLPAAFNTANGMITTTAQGTKVKLGSRMVEVSFVELDIDELDITGSRASVLTVPSASQPIYMRLSQENLTNTRCAFLNAANQWSEDGVYVPTVEEISAVYGARVAAAGGNWCAAYHLSLFTILEEVLETTPETTPFAETTTAPDSGSTSAPESAAVNLQDKVVTLTSGLDWTLLQSDPYTAVVVPKPDPPVGTSVALVSLPLPDPMTPSEFIPLTAPGASTIPLAIPSGLVSSVNALYPAVSVAEVLLGVADSTALNLPVAFDNAKGTTIRTAEGRDLKLGYKMVEVSVMDLDVSNGAQVVEIVNSSKPIYLRLSERNFTDATCAFLDSANQWSEAGTGVAPMAEISAVYGSEVAAAGGFWCATFHLSLFAILEGGAVSGNVTSENRTAVIVQNQVVAWAEPVVNDALTMFNDDPYQSVIVQVPGMVADIAAGIVTVPFADPMSTSNYMTLASVNGEALVAIPVAFRSQLLALYPAMVVASFDTSAEAQAALGVPAQHLMAGQAVTTDQGNFKIGLMAMQVSFIDLAIALSVSDVGQPSSVFYVRLSEVSYPDSAVCASLNMLNKWSQDAIYRPTSDEVMGALGSESPSNGFWCATRHLGLFAILEAIDEDVASDVTGAVQNLVLALTADLGLFNSALAGAGSSPYSSVNFDWAQGGIRGFLVTIPMPDPSLTPVPNFVRLAAGHDSAVTIVLPASLSMAHDILSVAEIQDVNSATSAAAASTNISIPADLVAPNSKIVLADGRTAILQSVLVEVSILNSNPSQPQVVDISGTLLYFRLSMNAFSDAAMCAFLSNGTWSQEGVYRPNDSELAGVLADAQAEDVGTGFWCATSHLSLFGILELEEEAACDGVLIGGSCTPIAVLAGAIGGPLGCCCLCCVVICCIKCRRPTAGKVKLTDNAGSAHEFGFQVVKESTLSRVMRTPTSRSRGSGRGNDQQSEPAEVEAVKIHVKWDVDVDKAQEANFDFSVGANGEKGSFLAVTDTGMLMPTDVKPAKSEKSHASDNQSESPRSSRHRMLSEAELKVMQDVDDEESPSHEVEAQEPDSETLIVGNLDDEADSPMRIKSATGYEAYDGGSHVEYWSSTHAKWLQGAVDGIGIVVPADPGFPTYNLNLKGRSSKQRREFVELSCIRKPFREGHFVSVQLAGQENWTPAVIVGRQSVPLGYRVLLIAHPNDGECVTLTADRVRSRFPDGQKVVVYRGLDEGWHDGVVRCDKPDHEVWPRIPVELDSVTEAAGEVVECFHYLVQIAQSNDVVSPSRSEPASPTRVEV